MAKTATAEKADPEATAKQAEGTVSAKVKKAIDGIKRPFMAYASAFGKVAETRAELAPKFMKAYGMYLSEGGRQFTAFVRMIDPAVPMHRDEENGERGYRDHPSYQAADYLRRLDNRQDRGDNRARPVRSGMVKLARLIAVVQAISSEPELLWKGIQTEFNMTDRQITSLKRVVATVQPLVKIPNIKPARLTVVHVEESDRQQAAEARGNNRGDSAAAPARGRGQGVRRSA